MDQLVYSFAENDGSPENVLKLGNKGAQLAEMTRIGLPVPPGFSIATKACVAFFQNSRQWPEGLQEQVRQKLAELESNMGRKLGDAENPLLVSVRSGSYVSMPGMMDTILNLGMNESSVRGFAAATGNERTAYDSYRRFIQMFGDVVLGVKHEKFEALLEKKKNEAGAKLDTELTAEHLRALIADYKALIRASTGKDFPQEPWEQLRLAINAVFESWNTERAVTYRRIHKLDDNAGTGVNVQAMVFGNMGNDSGSGVAFTRNPSTGESAFYGEYLINAQGEDVVAGIRTPQPIAHLREQIPQCYEQLANVAVTLEEHYRDVQDLEFTIEQGKLYMLQTRKGKRTAQAGVRISVDMVHEGRITKEEAVRRVEPEQLNHLLHKQISPDSREKARPVIKGLPASPGAAVGRAAFSAKDAVEMSAEGERVILVRQETSPEDIEGMHVAQGILTARGGMTSHAAVVSRGMGKCCVAGAAEMSVAEPEKRAVTRQGAVIKEGDIITLDGSTGEVYLGELQLVAPQIGGEFSTLLSWADGFAKMKVRTNADTPRDSKKARDFGAQGIGLCRTEHMFFEGDRVTAMREMILASNAEERRKALGTLLPMQEQDFLGIYEAMDKLPVTIRLLDPPLHEFLPHTEADMTQLAEHTGRTVPDIRQTAESLREFNPMLGHRGCRLAVTYPEIYEMQVRAIIRAALRALEKNITPMPEIEIPIVGNAEELQTMLDLVRRVVREEDPDGRVWHRIGTMIELPRACVIGDRIAAMADFMSFGTNDLTQTTLGFSRDDAGRFIAAYIEKGILKEDPFSTIDEEGVGSLMKMCVEKARAAAKQAGKDIEIGICGEHGGDPKSIMFCHTLGLDYVSCSPYRVPIARLAAGQAGLNQ